MRRRSQQVPVCPRCRGAGIINQPISPLPGATARRTCPRCHGTGVGR